MPLSSLQFVAGRQCFEKKQRSDFSIDFFQGNHGGPERVGTQRVVFTVCTAQASLAGHQPRGAHERAQSGSPVGVVQRGCKRPDPGRCELAQIARAIGHQDQEVVVAGRSIRIDTPIGARQLQGLPGFNLVVLVQVVLCLEPLFYVRHQLFFP